MNPAALFAGGLAAGLAAGTASCAAVQGGLLIGLVSRKAPGNATANTSANAFENASGNAGRPSRALPPVVAFLTGRLAAHTALGALLGLAGAAVRIGPGTRAALLVAAGTVVVVLAVRMLRRRRETGCSPAGEGPARVPIVGALPGRATTDLGRDRPPACGAAGAKATRAGARSPTVVRAAGLGMATILVPCGVTVGMEVVAVSTGSAAGGAAALAGLATGTTPALAALGLLVRRLASTRLAALAGVAALAAGLFTIGSGLRLGGWLPDLSQARFGSPAAAAGRALTGADGVQRLTVWATGRGFRPGVAVAAAGRPVEIVFRTRDNGGCTRTVAIDDHDVVLPVNGERVVRLAARPEGRLRYACGMGMYVGFVRFERVP
ncbi:sulfite exporter TauE/SafE family protein [Microbispora sp. H11081]|uniref:urease accessory protein UreH domain-containing protein n=1 Tax=Microbispora sp. H11081 TaxID=2729107 RepID=UPI001472B063|nr:sulfite exporter TauE/SafE family protein [Microbispora sp. H11081]